MRALPFSAVIILALGATAIAQPAGRNPKREAEIEGQLLAIAPAAVPPFRQATRFMDRGDYAAAVPLFRDAMAHAPRFTPILRRLGGALVVTGRKDEGLNLLEQALAAERSPENLISLAQRLAYPRPREQGTPAERERALALATEASDGYQGSDDPSYLTLVAYVAISLDRVPEFKGAVTELKRKYPAETVTHYLAAVMAATDADWISAEREAKAAGRLGMPPEAVEGFLSSGVRTRATIKKVEYGTIYLMLAWAGGLVLLFLAGVALSRATLRSIERSDPNVSASPPERFLRGVYRALVGVSAAYYYLSLPFVAVLVLGAAAAFTYGFILLGHIPIKLVILIGVAALITVWKMVQSLLLRIPPSDPGRQLTEAEAPRLFELAREVAERVGTRPIDEIRVTPGTDLAVYERGTTRHRAVEGEQRVLVLGVATLNDFRRSPSRAVLAHEYGHFSHRDTAGGALALRVR